MAVPDKLTLNITDLHLNKSIFAKDIPLPEGATLITDENAVIVHCVPPHADADGGELGAGAEPEVIGKKEKDEAEAKKA
jgi:large subunit ribosomal protein L25